MKILMVITGMQSGGAERVMATLCNELSQHHLVRLAIMKTAATDYEISNQVQVVAGNVEGQKIWKAVQFSKKEIENWNPDIVLSFMTKTNIIALLARKMAKVKPPVVIAERANPYHTRGILRVVRNILYHYANGAVFQTEQAQLYYKNIIECKSAVLKNPLNPDFKVKPFCGERSSRIVCVGRLSEEKNQRLLIDAFTELALKFPNYTVEFYGDGPLKENLKQHIQELGMQDKIKIMGRKDHVQDYIKDAACFVLPSNSEGMPNALLEAMALGIPSIATDCPIGGSAFIIEDNENGILIPMNDEESLKAALTKCLVEKEFARRIGEKATRVINDFDAKKVCKEWDTYLQEVYRESKKC